MKNVIRGLSMITIVAVMLFSNIFSVNAASWGNNGNGKQKQDYKSNYSSVVLENSTLTTTSTSNKAIVLSFSGNINYDSSQVNTQILLMKGSKKSIPITITLASSSRIVITPNSDFSINSAYKLYVYGLKDSNNLTIKPFTLVVNPGKYSSDNDEDKNDNSRSFSDVKSNFWAYEAIMELVDRGIIKGYTDNTFKPDSTVTRSEFASMFTKSLNLTTSNNTQTFTDVPISSWDYSAVEAAKNYLTGYKNSNGTMYFYGTNAAVREDMAVALVKALKVTVESNNTVLQQLYTDYSLISVNLRDYVYTAYKNGIMIGSSNKFNPQENLTRAEAATLMQRILDAEKVVVDGVEKVVIGGTNTNIIDEKDARLQNLWVNGNSISGFSSDTYTYNVKLPSGTSTLPTVTVLSYNTSGATATVTQTTSLPGYSVIVVTSKDRTTSKTYIIYFTIEDELNTDATLANLTINGTGINGFNTNILTYNVTLAKGTTIVPIVNALINDTGNATAVIVPAQGLPGTTTIIVTAEDGVTIRVYTIRFTVLQ